MKIGLEKIKELNDFNNLCKLFFNLVMLHKLKYSNFMRKLEPLISYDSQSHKIEELEKNYQLANKEKENYDYSEFNEKITNLKKDLENLTTYKTLSCSQENIFLLKSALVEIASIVIHNKRMFIASNENNHSLITEWDIISGKLLNSINTENLVYSTMIIENRNILVYSQKKGVISFYNCESREVKMFNLKIHTIFSLKNFDENRLIFHSSHSLYYLNIGDKLCTEIQLGYLHYILTIDLLKFEDKTILAVTNDEMIRLYENEKHIVDLQGQSKIIRSSIKSQDKKIITIDSSGKIIIWVLEKDY